LLQPVLIVLMATMVLARPEIQVPRPTAPTVVL
jgi:hypothetical protein